MLDHWNWCLHREHRERALGGVTVQCVQRCAVARAAHTLVRQRSVPNAFGCTRAKRTPSTAGKEPTACEEEASTATAGSRKHRSLPKVVRCNQAPVRAPHTRSHALVLCRRQQVRASRIRCSLVRAWRSRRGSRQAEERRVQVLRVRQEME